MKKKKITNNWLVGFVDGEGCLPLKWVDIGISKNNTMKQGYQVIPPHRGGPLTIVQHIKDLELLYAIKSYLNCGIVQSNRGKNDKKDKWAERWSTQMSGSKSYKRFR